MTITRRMLGDSRTTQLRVLDLFSGIGGFSLGLERTGGFKTVAFCEIEDYPRRVLAKHWPGVPIYRDVRELTADALARDGIAVDVICGGFPCQDISAAGRGAGIEGARSGLWSEYVRLVGELRPRFVIVENVAMLLGRGLGRVLGDLAALGYDATWDCIPAAAVGAPHRRDRVWIVAYPGGEQHEGDCAALGRALAAQLHTADPETMHRTEIEWCEPHGDHEGFGEVADADDVEWRIEQQFGSGTGPRSWDELNRCCEGPCNANVSGLALGKGQSRDVGEEFAPTVGTGWWLTEPDVGRVAHGVPAKLDRGRHGKEEHVAEARAEGDSISYGMPSVRSDRNSGKASPGLHEAGGRRGSLPALPHQGGSEGWHAKNTADQGVRPVREGVHADAQQEAQSVRPRVPFDCWPHERGEALGQVWAVEPDVGRVAEGVTHRVDRLRCLGNAVVPQIPELIGQAILQAMRHP